jgi:hypothetical protein
MDIDATSLCDLTASWLVCRYPGELKAAKRD